MAERFDRDIVAERFDREALSFMRHGPARTNVIRIAVVIAALLGKAIPFSNDAGELPAKPEW